MGNLHPTFWNPGTDAASIASLHAALDESIDVALAMVGTITGEHGVGNFKRRWLPLEQAPEVLELQQRIKRLFGPMGILNPGKAI